VDSLLKERGHFMAEKKEEPKPEEAKPDVQPPLEIPGFEKPLPEPGQP
jgi:hypothetical protein